MAKPTIIHDDFAKLDFRVGEAIDVSDVTDSDRLYRLTVDFGPEIGTKIIFSGIRKWYNTASLLNKKFIFLVNIAPKQFKIGDQVYESHGMILGAGDNEAALCILDKDLENGASIK